MRGRGGRRGRVGVAAAAVAALLLAGCTPECSIDPCPPGGGTVAAFGPDGSQRWRTAVDDRLERPPLVSGGHVIVEGCGGVHVLDAATGRLVLTTDRVEDPVGVAAGLVIGADADREGHDGKGVTGVSITGGGGWGLHHSAPSSDDEGDARFKRSMVLAGDAVVGVHGETLTLHRPSGDRTRREVQLPDLEPTGRVVDLGGSRFAVGTTDGSVVGADLATQRLLWRVAPGQVSRTFSQELERVGDVLLVSVLGDENASSPVAVAEASAVASTDGRVLWRHEGFVVGAATQDVVVLLSESEVVALDPPTGRQLWRLETPSFELGDLHELVSDEDNQPVAAAGGVVALTDPLPEHFGTSLGFDAHTGEQLWSLDGHLRPVGFGEVFGVLTGSRPHEAAGSREPDGERDLEVLDPRTGRGLWVADVEAADAFREPGRLLVADPVRQQVILADLPEVPQAMCE